MGQLSVGGVSAQFRPVLALLTESGTYTVPYAGWYRIIAIGHGAGGYGDDSDPLSTPAPGGAGGGGYLDKYLPAGAVLTATISDMASTLSYGGSALISAARGSGKTAGSVTGSGVWHFPATGPTLRTSRRRPASMTPVSAPSAERQACGTTRR